MSPRPSCEFREYGFLIGCRRPARWHVLAKDGRGAVVCGHHASGRVPGHELTPCCRLVEGIRDPFYPSGTDW